MSTMMDRDGDGTITVEEMSRLPQAARDRMGLTGSKAMSVKEFSEKASTRFRERMEQRTVERERESKSRTSSGSSVFLQRNRQKFTQPLPKEYEPGDADEDGQIALFEWAAWKRSDMPAFFDMDSNNDGFLVPKELQDDDDKVAFNRERLAVSGSSTSRRGGSASASTSRLQISGSSDSSASRIRSGGRTDRGGTTESSRGRGRGRDEGSTSGRTRDRSSGRDRSERGR